MSGAIIIVALVVLERIRLSRTTRKTSNARRRRPEKWSGWAQDPPRAEQTKRYSRQTHQPNSGAPRPRIDLQVRRTASALKVLGFSQSDTPTPAELKAAFRYEIKKHHPDTGGTEMGLRRVMAAHDFLKGRG